MILLGSCSPLGQVSLCGEECLGGRCDASSEDRGFGVGEARALEWEWDGPITDQSQIQHVHERGREKKKGNS